MTKSCLAPLAMLATSAAIGPGLAFGASISPTTTTDQFGEDPGRCSLRETVQAANTDASFGGCPAGSGSDTIQLPDSTFVLGFPGDEEANAQGDIDVDGVLSIVHSGIGAATVNGGGLDRVFDLQGGGSSLTISGLTITGGVAASGTGGGIRNLLGTLTLSNVTLSNNASSAGGNGGGLQNNGTALLINMTISGNRTANNGGGIRNTGTATIRDVTISGNTADSDGDSSGNGGGISSDAGAITTIGNTIVASNGVGFGSAPGFAAPDCAGMVGTAGHNLIGSTVNCTFNPIVASGLADLVNQNPQLGPLADNGGPTFTHAIAAASPALGRGGGLGCDTSDQRGAPRSPGACDIGAYERVECKSLVVNRVGTEGPDALIGTDEADAFLMLGGSDTASGLGGNDSFCGGAGNDSLRGGTGNDNGSGGTGNDRFIGGAGRDKASGSAGRDKLRGGDGRDKLRGGADRDGLKGGAGKDGLRGGSGNDVCNGGGGRRDRGSSCETEKKIP